MSSVVDTTASVADMLKIAYGFRDHDVQWIEKIINTPVDDDFMSKYGLTKNFMQWLDIKLSASVKNYASVVISAPNSYEDSVNMAAELTRRIATVHHSRVVLFDKSRQFSRFDLDSLDNIVALDEDYQDVCYQPLEGNSHHLCDGSEDALRKLFRLKPDTVLIDSISPEAINNRNHSLTYLANMGWQFITTTLREDKRFADGVQNYFDYVIRLDEEGKVQEVVNPKTESIFYSTVWSRNSHKELYKM